jgi:hypothetical protein
MLARHVRSPPQRRTERHRQHLAVRVLFAPRLAGDLVFLRQPGIEHPAEGDVAGEPAGRDDEAASRLDAHLFTVALRDDPLHSPRAVVADDPHERVAQEDLDTLRSGALFERAHQAGARTSVDRDLQIIGVHLRAEQPGNSAAVDQRRRHLLKQHAVVQQEIERRRVFIRPYAHEVAITVAELEIVEVGVIQVDLIGGIEDAELLLQARAAAKGNTPAAHHRVSADIVVLLDDENRGALIARHDRRTQPGRACARDHNVRRTIPLRDAALRGRVLLRGHANKRSCADAKRALRDEFSSVHFTATSTSYVENV